MEVLTVSEAKNCTGGFKFSAGVALIGGTLISFCLGVFNAFFSPTCTR